MGLIAWRSVVRHKGRSAFLALCVVIGVAFVAGTFVLTDSIKTVYTRLFDDAYKGVALNVRSRSDLGSMDARAPMPVALEASIRAVPGVRVAEGGVFAIGGRIFDTKGKGVGNAFAPTFLASWSNQAELSSFTLVNGKAPIRGTDVVLDAEAVSAAHLKVGDSVRIQTLSGVKRFRLVGVAKFGTAGNMGGASVVLFDLATAQTETNRVGHYDAILVAAAPGVTPGTLQDRVQAVIGHRYEALTGSQLSTESSSAINDNLSFFATFLLVFAAISLFVGAFIVFNTFAIVVAQRTREMALLRALGADGRQVIGGILVESLLVGLVASVIGLLGGIGLAMALKSLLAGLGFKLPAGPVVVLARTVLVSVLGGVLVTVVSAIAPALRAARVPPLAAVRTVTTTSPRQLRRRVELGAALAVFEIGRAHV